jgi:hypothetical protein
MCTKYFLCKTAFRTVATSRDPSIVQRVSQLATSDTVRATRRPGIGKLRAVIPTFYNMEKIDNRVNYRNMLKRTSFYLVEEADL